MVPKRSACVAALLLLAIGCVEGVRSPHCVDVLMGVGDGTTPSSHTCLFGYLDNGGLQSANFSPNSPSGPNSPNSPNGPGNPGGNNGPGGPSNNSGPGYATAGPGGVSVSYGGSGGVF